MYSLIIIDDEQSFIQDICNYIDFNEMNINLIATANNGEDGLKKIISFMPDIILCDIDMPIMNGLNMLEKVSQLPNYKPQIIMLTAHDNFSYAKKAINLRVIEYLVKPCMPNELISALTTAKTLCDEAKYSSSVLYSYAELQNMKFINDIIHKNQYTKIDLLKKQHDMGISLKANNYSLLRIQFVQKSDSNISEDVQAAKNNIIGLLMDSFENSFHTNYISNHIYFLILDTPDDTITAKVCEKILAECEIPDFNIYISISSNCESVNKLPTLLEQVKYCNKFLFCFEANKVLVYSIIKKYIKTSFNSQRLVICENNLKNIASVGFLNSKQYLEAIYNFTQTFEYYEPEYLKTLIYTTIISMFTVLDNDDIKNEPEKNPVLWIDILSTHSISELIDLCKSIISKFDGMNNSSIEFRYNTISNYVKKYVYDNYMYSCSVSDIAKSLYVSERRIREYFLTVNKISISDFVRNYRMQKALELIKSSKYKIQEVMEMVGYDTEHRFREAFTKYYGHPPSYYQKKNN